MLEPASAKDHHDAAIKKLDKILAESGDSEAS
jgi:hypothetical protein